MRPLLRACLAGALLAAGLGLGCKTVRTKVDNPDQPRNMVIERDVNRETWWPWSGKKETPEQKEARQKSEALWKDLVDAAEDGDAGSQFTVGGLYLAGQPPLEGPNRVEAAFWFRKAAEQRHVQAMMGYATCLDLEARSRGDTSAATRSTILQWYRKAADKGQADAQYAAGVMLEEDGQRAEAYGYYVKAMRSGNLDACYRAAMFKIESSDAAYCNPEEGVELLKRAAEQQHPKALLRLADCYANGYGVDRDYDLMIRYLYLAATEPNGEVEAQAKLGFCFATGKGVKQDWDMAFKWYKLAAGRGYPPAMYELGNCFMQGAGTPIDLIKGVEWYTKASEAKFPWGTYGLAVAAATGKGRAKNEAEAVELFKQAAGAGIAMAMFNLGIHYLEGRGVPVDATTAIFWFEKAAAADTPRPDALIEIAQIYLEGKAGMPRDRQKARDYLVKATRFDETRERAETILRIHQLM